MLGIFTLPWRARAADRQHELAKLEAAQNIIRLATATRKAWVEAVAAPRATYMADAEKKRPKPAANWPGAWRAWATGAGCSRPASNSSWPMPRRSWRVRSRPQCAAARSSRGSSGLWGTQVQYRLPARLPDLPAAPADLPNVEARALRGRLDVRAAVASTRHLADSMGLRRVHSYLDGLTLGYVRNTTFDNAAGTKRRQAQLGGSRYPLPLFDWGGARHARAQASLHAVGHTRARGGGQRPQ